MKRETQRISRGVLVRHASASSPEFHAPDKGEPERKNGEALRLFSAGGFLAATSAVSTAGTPIGVTVRVVRGRLANGVMTAVVGKFRGGRGDCGSLTRAVGVLSAASAGIVCVPQRWKSGGDSTTSDAVST